MGKGTFYYPVGIIFFCYVIKYILKVTLVIIQCIQIKKILLININKLILYCTTKLSVQNYIKKSINEMYVLFQTENIEMFTLIRKTDKKANELNITVYY